MTPIGSGRKWPRSHGPNQNDGETKRREAKNCSERKFLRSRFLILDGECEGSDEPKETARYQHVKHDHNGSNDSYQLSVTLML